MATSAVRWLRPLLRPALLLLLCALSLQLVFVARIALMVVVDPQSTTFQRSEVWRLLVDKGQVAGAQQGVDDAQISAQRHTSGSQFSAPTLT